MTSPYLQQKPRELVKARQDIADRKKIELDQIEKNCDNKPVLKKGKAEPVFKTEIRIRTG